MPADLPHWRTVYDVADGWHNSGAAGKKHDELRRQCRIAAGRRSEPAAAVIGSQPVKARIATEQSRYRRTVRDCERLPGHHETIRVLPG